MDLYNSLSQKIEPFRPEDGNVKVYICGITPYDTTHLGHAFTYTVFDILIRYLESRGFTVTYVQNVTDIDDDILRKAREVGEDWRALGNRWTRHFIEDMQLLNVRPPNYYPRATEVIPEITEMVSRLIESGAAYERGGSVYYRIEQDPEYGKLSHLSKEEMLPVANERGNRPDDPNKQNPLDFVHWQAQAPGEPAWPSPWGPGRPGWHIECSAMSTHFLGNTLDIHSGGADLIFPHHESEIAQVEPVTGQKPFVRDWMHVAMVRYEGEKMSKSLGNLVMIRDLLKTWSPDAIRLYLAMHHYRDSWSYHEDDLAQASLQAERLREAVLVVGGSGAALELEPFLTTFTQAMDDDLNTPAAMAALTNLAGEILAAAGTGWNIDGAQQALRQAARVFGLRLETDFPEPRVIAGWAEHLKKFE